MSRLRSAPRAPLAVAGILATPLFFVGLMAMSLALEKPIVHHVVRHGRIVAKLADASGTTEAEIWLTAFAVPLFMAAVGIAAMLVGRRGVLLSAAAAVIAVIALLAPLDGWTKAHEARYPDGVDLISTAAGSQDIYLRGEWERSARRTARQLGIAAIGMAALAIGTFALLELRRRRGPVPPPPEAPPLATTAGAPPPA